MKARIVTGLLITVLLVGCGGGAGSVEIGITTPNGFSFTLVQPDSSYLDTISSFDSHLYAIHVRPGFEYTIYLDTTYGDSDLFLYYDYTLSSQSLMVYSELPGTESDSVSFESDFHGTVYIEVYGDVDSRYFVSMTESYIVR